MQLAGLDWVVRSVLLYKNVQRLDFPSKNGTASQTSCTLKCTLSLNILRLCIHELVRSSHGHSWCRKGRREEDLHPLRQLWFGDLEV